MFKTIRKYPDAQVMKTGVNESAHLFQAVKEFVGYLDGGKKRMASAGSFNVMAYKVLHDLKQYCLLSHCSFLTQPHSTWALTNSLQLSQYYLSFTWNSPTFFIFYFSFRT